ncbi:MAG: hypothetical protein GY780_02375 [bacterium]|nr:hypothetical protein [bacterium]
MKTFPIVSLLMLATIVLTGCGDGFPDEEMHFGIENKCRPYAVIVEPPEAAPGDTVMVTFKAQTPDPDELDITWRIAQDFNRGIYETDEVERNYLDIEAPFPVTDDDGFLTQTFQWIVPEDALLISSAIPETLDDPVMVYLAEELIGPAAGSPPTKSAVDAWLKELSPEQVNEMGFEEKMATYALTDRFACQVRFRAVLRSDIVIDVTRNLTIRHTGRLEGPNTNNNTHVTRFGVAAIEKVDASTDDLQDASIAQTWHPFIEGSERVAERVSIPRNDSWTYYLVVDFFDEQYSSPFNPELLLSEQGNHRWYYYRQDDPASDHHFFVTDDGDEAEMWNLAREARIIPANSGSTFRVVSAVRDERSEWVMYHAVPGGVIQEGIVEFVTP